MTFALDAADLGVLRDGLLGRGLAHELERALHLHRALLRRQLGVDEQLALDGLLVVVRIEGDGLPVLHDDEELEARLLPVLVLADLGGLEADLGRPQEPARLAVLAELHEPGRRSTRWTPCPPRRPPCSRSRGTSRRTACSRGSSGSCPSRRRRRCPASPGPSSRRARGELREARVDDGDLQGAVHEPLRHPRAAVRRAVVRVEEVRADEEDVLGVLGVGLPVELLAVLEPVARRTARSSPCRRSRATPGTRSCGRGCSPCRRRRRSASRTRCGRPSCGPRSRRTGCSSARSRGGRGR